MPSTYIGAVLNPSAGGTTISSNTLTGVGNQLISTVNGVAGALTPVAGTIDAGKALGFNAAGTLVLGTTAAAVTNTLTGTGNQITSTVNGVAADLIPVAGTVDPTKVLGFATGGDLTVGQLAAAGITVTPVGNLVSTTVQAALEELQGDIDGMAAGLVFRGSWDASSGAFPSGAGSGDTYVVSISGTVDGVSFAVGDTLYATVDGASTSTFAGSWVQASGGTLQTAATVPFTPAGALAATNVQAALEELDSEKSDVAHVHAATAVTFTPGGNIAATNVQGAIAELDTDKAPVSHTHTVAFASAGDALTVDVEGVTATLTPTTGVIDPTKHLGFDAAGNLIIDSLPSGEATTASNGLTLTGVDVALGGSLTAATIIATSAANTLSLTGLEPGAGTDELVVVDPSGVLRRVAPSSGVTLTDNASGTVTIDPGSGAQDAIRPISELTANTGLDSSADLLVVFDASTSTHVTATIDEILPPTPSAGDIAFAPYGNIAAADVEFAIRELEDEKAPLAHTHTVDITAATNSISVTVEGITDTLTPAAGSLAPGALLGFDGSGALVVGSQPASNTPVLPLGNLASTEVQAALYELQGDIDLLAGAVFKGGWDASSGVFPTATAAGWWYITTTSGVTGGVTFNVGDQLWAVIANPSTTVYAANWVRIPVGAVPAYVDTFAVGDWTAGTGVHTLSYTALTHGQGVAPFVLVQAFNGSAYEAISVEQALTGSGDLTITVPSGVQFDGRVLISSGLGGGANASLMGGATANGATPGSAGTVVGPAAGDNRSVFRGDGTWGVNVPAWEANTFYRQGSAVISSGGLYTRNANGISTALFITDLPNWTLVAGQRSYGLVTLDGSFAPPTPYGDLVAEIAATENLTFDLPSAASSNAMQIRFSRTDATNFTVAIAANGTDTINGSATYSLSNQFDSITLVSNGVGRWLAF